MGLAVRTVVGLYAHAAANARLRASVSFLCPFPFAPNLRTSNTGPDAPTGGYREGAGSGVKRGGGGRSLGFKGGRRISGGGRGAGVRGGGGKGVLEGG